MFLSNYLKYDIMYIFVEPHALHVIFFYKKYKIIYLDYFI